VANFAEATEAEMLLFPAAGLTAEVLLIKDFFVTAMVPSPGGPEI
jgi:hypothetical protein